MHAHVFQRRRHLTTIKCIEYVEEWGERWDVDMPSRKLYSRRLNANRLWVQILLITRVYNILLLCVKAGFNTTRDIGSSGDSDCDNSGERLCTVSTKQYYHNNVTTSITIPCDISHSKQFSTILLQNAQKKADKVAVGAVAFKQKKYLTKRSHSFLMTQPTDCSQSVCLSQ
uniref:Neur_chan_LBD domain-containing protein n=1 Tax=Elaeophora elaphi TaxID=1147741 RepID=A0A0R3RJ37_9BILA